MVLRDRQVPAAVLAHRFPNVPNLGDMTKIKCLDNTKGIFEYDTTNGTVRSEFGRIDLLVGGTPCQSFSVAGNQQGLRGVSGLALTYVELLRAMRPTWFVWENVPGVFSTNGGRDFETLIRAFDEVGYSLAWRVIDVQYCRVDGFPRAIPQRRRRVFVVGHSSGDARYPAEVLFEPSCLRGTTPPRRVKGKGFTAGVGNGVESASEPITLYCRGGDDTNAATMVEVCPTQIKYQGGTPIVCPTYKGVDLYNGTQTGDVGCTIRGEAGGHKDGMPCVIAIEGNGARPSHKGTGYNEDGAQFTLNHTEVHAVATRSSVRRITPVEAERLMGFPDNWTQIPWRGKPAEDCPDGPRYKCCGNSMGVNVMRWLGLRIERVERICSSANANINQQKGTNNDNQSNEKTSRSS